MKKALFLLGALALSSSAFAAAPDCTKFNNQISYNAVEPIKDIIAGKISATVRMYSNRCEKAGQTLDVVLSSDPKDPSNGDRRKPQARILLKQVASNLAFASLTDAMAKAQGLSNAGELRAFLTGIYGKDDKGNPVDISKETWTYIEFSLVR